MLNLSDMAKIALLQEVVRDVKRYERSGFIACIVGIVMSVAGFSTTSLSGNSIYLGIVGVVISAIGFVEFLHYQRVYSKMIGELASMAFKSAVPCPRCEKELPKGEFDFCPFCGSPLQS